MILKFIKGFLCWPIICTGLPLGFFLVITLTKFTIPNAIIIAFPVIFLPGILFLWIRQMTIFWKKDKPFSFGLITGFIPAFFYIIGVGFYFLNLAYRPDVDLVIKKLEQYKIEHNIYPQNLSTIDIKLESDDRLSYYPKESSFRLCFYVPLSNTANTCYDSTVKKWQ